MSGLNRACFLLFAALFSSFLGCSSSESGDEGAAGAAGTAGHAGSGAQGGSGVERPLCLGIGIPDAAPVAIR